MAVGHDGVSPAVSWATSMTQLLPLSSCVEGDEWYWAQIIIFSRPWGVLESSFFSFCKWWCGGEERERGKKNWPMWLLIVLYPFSSLFPKALWSAYFIPITEMKKEMVRDVRESPQRDAREAAEPGVKSGVMWPESGCCFNHVETRMLAQTAGCSFPKCPSSQLTGAGYFTHPGQRAVPGPRGIQSWIKNIPRVLAWAACVQRSAKPLLSWGQKG